MLRRTLRPFVLMEGDEPPPGGPPPAPAPEPGPPAPAPETPDNRAFAEMRRRAEAAERERNEAREALAERERQEAEEQGRYRELAEQERARADGLAQRMAEQEQARTIEAHARALRFRDPDLVTHLLPQSVDRNDQDAVNTALAAIAVQRPHLIDSSTPPPPSPSGGPPGGNPPERPGLTAEQIRAMTPQQVAALDPDVLNKALAS